MYAGWWLENWPENWPGAYSDEWVICFRCEGDVRCRGYVSASAYGPVCHRCLAEMPWAEFVALEAMNALAVKLLSS